MNNENHTISEFLTVEIVRMDEEGVFSDEAANIVVFVNLYIIATCFSLLGITTNVINIFVFAKQGFQETVNITLFAIAISDLWACITLIWAAICYNPLMVDSDAPFLSVDIEFLTGGGPHQIALNATAWYTVIVTFERCICIAFPLRVKTIITKGRIKSLVLCVSFLVIASKIPMYYTTRLDWKFVPSRNKTMFGLVFVENRDMIDQIALYIGECLSPLLSFCIEVVCTAVLIIKMRQQMKWRQSSTATTNKEEITATEKRIIKMVLTVAAIFITCYTPSVFVGIWLAKEPEFRISGKYHNNFIVAVNTAIVFESLNASVNIFVYYRMSAKYRLTLKEYCCICKKKEANSEMT